jgi:endonuclease-8
LTKNEVLFRIGVHPESLLGRMPPEKLSALVREAVVYSQDFLVWKKAFVLKKHYQVYRQPVCPRDAGAVIKRKLGKRGRVSFYCPRCQRLYV